MSKKVTTPAPSNPSSNSSSGSSVPKWIAEKLDAVVRRITDFVLWKSSLSREDAEEIAAQAVGYALKPALFGTGTWPKNKDDLTRLARSKAKNLILDRYRHDQARPVMTSLDKMMVGREGDEVAEHYALSVAAVERWREDTDKADRQELGALALSHLPEMFDELGYNETQRGVFVEAYLEKGEVREVAEKYGITPNYLYGIVHHAKEGLREVGPRYLAAA